MRECNKYSINSLVSRYRQQGGMTIFTAIFILILMTLMILYASRIGLIEQRVSANDLRQKTAFQAAEAGLDYAVEYFLAANSRVVSASATAAPDGSGSDPVTYRPGWFSAGNTLWSECPETPADTHPCGGDINAGGEGSYFFDDPSTTTTGSYDAIPMDAGILDNLPAGTEVRVTGVICPRSFDSATCLGSGGIPDPDDPLSSPVAFALILMAYGYSDCNDDDGNGSIDVLEECRGRANVLKPFGTNRLVSGSSSVPLVTKNTLPASGTAEVVPNPDAGGEGVPISIWANSNASCGPLDPDGSAGGTMETSGSFKTCQMHEWYGVDFQPEDAMCNQAVCNCTLDESISYREAGTPVIGIDVMTDVSFPCDLFEYYFGYPSSQYQAVKANMKVINDCSILDEESYGYYWFSGDTCRLGDVGTINNPVILVSAADSLTSINANEHFFGVLFLANVEDSEGDAAFKPGGGATVYGSVIVDVLFDTSGFAGTFRVVYNETSLLNAGGSGGLGGLAGGWRDFGMPTINWE